MVYFVQEYETILTEMQKDQLRTISRISLKTPILAQRRM